MTDLVRKVLEVAAAQGAVRVTAISVTLGALSHFTPAHFREHFEDAARGTLAEGARIDAVIDPDLAAPHAQGVRLDRLQVSAP